MPLRRLPQALSGRDATTTAEDEDGAACRRWRQATRSTARGIEAEQHFTEPPPRYTEATLVKKMEELGIGRPSTYASTLTVLRDREYVRLEKKRLIPEDKGRLVTAFLESFFERYVEYDFTADLEEKLDQISAGELDWKDVLRDFWREFIAAVDEIKELRVAAGARRAERAARAASSSRRRADGADPRTCPSCGTGQLGLKLGKFGAFIGCSNYPECRFTRQLADSGANGEAAARPATASCSATIPRPGSTVTLAPAASALTCSSAKPNGKEKPKRASHPQGLGSGELDLDGAWRCCALPREVGAHPETGKPIIAGIGRYGPFVQHDGTYANLDRRRGGVHGRPQPRRRACSPRRSGGAGARRRRRRRSRTLGEHPELGGAVQVRAGRYGPYVKHGKVNATMPKDIEPEASPWKRRSS